MAQTLTLDWLNENEHRAFPLRFMRNREIFVKGFGRISPGAYDAAAGGYLANGIDTQFVQQVTPGDQILIYDTRGTVLKSSDGLPISATTIYTSTTWSPPASYEYSIVKKNFTPDANNTVDPNFNGLLLDANLVYNNTAGSETAPLEGKLVRAYPSGSDLIFEVVDQSDFVVANYLDTETKYPQYVRNADGSLLVVGEVAKSVLTEWTFTNCFFEPSVISRMDRGWRGVGAIAFNATAPLTGYIDFLEGYQVGLGYTPSTNSIKITAAKAVGKPIGCDRIFGEDAPDDCSLLLSYINGVNTRTDFGALDLVPGAHIAIYPDPDRHRIYVGLTFKEGDVCKTLPARPVSQL